MPPTDPFIAGLPLATAGSKSANPPLALTCALSFATCASNERFGTRPPISVESVIVPFAVRFIAFGVVPDPFATRCALIVLL